jgi:hypothetical protein
LREIRTYYKKACGNENACGNANASGNDVLTSRKMDEVSVIYPIGVDKEILLYAHVA